MRMRMLSQASLARPATLMEGGCCCQTTTARALQPGYRPISVVVAGAPHAVRSRAW